MERVTEPAKGRRAAADFPELVRSAQAGSIPAFDALVRRFQQMAIGYAGYLLGSSLHSEDAAQEAFLEAFRSLPALREANAFPHWLRLLVKKHCDRFTRSRPPYVPLDSVAEHPLPLSLEGEALRRDTQEWVRRLVQGLPAAEREVVTLYYLGDRSCAEIAGFLAVPVSTVKNRLNTARKRLRERMAPLMEMDEISPAPADPGFRERLFTRLYREYNERRAQDPNAADRSLLTRARENLLETIAQPGPVDRETAWHGHHVFWTLGDIGSAISLLERYLEQPLPPSEEAWARRDRFLLMAGLYDLDACKTIVTEHPVFVRWVQEQAAKSAIALRGEGFDRIPDSCLPLWALGGMSIANNYIGVDAFPQYEAMAEEIIGNTPKTAETRQMRFTVLFALVSQRAIQKRKQDALAAVEQIRALAQEEPDHFRNPLWALEAESSIIYIENRTDEDTAGIRAAAEQAIAVMDAWEDRLTTETPEAEAKQIRSDLADQRHNIAFLLMRTGQYDLSASLFESALAQKTSNVWTHLWGAASLWAHTKDRSRVLPLLKTAEALANPWRIVPGERRATNTFREDFQKQKEFADVWEDPEFLSVVAP